MNYKFICNNAGIVLNDIVYNGDYYHPSFFYRVFITRH
jgi:hypothetical protein